MRDVFQDLRYSVRSLARTPGFALLAILTLALGIGANSAIFSVINGVILKPLGYPQPDQLVMITSQFPGLGFDKFWVSPPEYFELRERAKSFREIGALSRERGQSERRRHPGARERRQRHVDAVQVARCLSVPRASVQRAGRPA